jgi:hypothetical protein
MFIARQADKLTEKTLTSKRCNSREIQLNQPSDEDMLKVEQFLDSHIFPSGTQNSALDAGLEHGKSRLRSRQKKRSKLSALEELVVDDVYDTSSDSTSEADL